MLKPALSFLTLVALALPSVATAQNLVTNGDFASDLSAWTLLTSSSIAASWSSSDTGSSPSSGSIAVTSSDPTNNPGYSLTAATQCVPVSGAVLYDLDIDILIPANQSRSGNGIGGVSFYSSADCSTGEMGGTSLQSTTTGAWESLATHVTSPATARSASVYLDIIKNEGGGTFEVNFDDVVFAPSGGSLSGSCTADATHLCLTGNRFRVSVQWTDYNTNVTAAATAVPFVDESGFFYFQDPSNIEIMVKVHDACNRFGHFWFFSAATTNVGYTITVTDTKTNQTETYSNPAHVLSAANTDQSSFSSCP